MDPVVTDFTSHKSKIGMTTSIHKYLLS